MRAAFLSSNNERWGCHCCAESVSCRYLKSLVPERMRVWRHWSDTSSLWGALSSALDMWPVILCLSLVSRYYMYQYIQAHCVDINNLCFEYCKLKPFKTQDKSPLLLATLVRISLQRAPLQFRLLCWGFGGETFRPCCIDVLGEWRADAEVFLPITWDYPTS